MRVFSSHSRVAVHRGALRVRACLGASPSIIRSNLVSSENFINLHNEQRRRIYLPLYFERHFILFCTFIGDIQRGKVLIFVVECFFFRTYMPGRAEFKYFNDVFHHWDFH